MFRHNRDPRTMSFRQTDLDNSLAFKVDSIEDARQFDEFLAEYQKSRQASVIGHIFLEHVFAVLKDHPEKGRLVAYFIELQLQHSLLNCDLCEIASLLGQKTSGAEVENFCHRVSLLRANSDFIFRYRAIWDKIMAIVILLRVPDRFQKFVTADSRKKYFFKVEKETGLIPREFVDHVIETTTAFDNKYRTEEAHGSGSTRKWSSGQLPDDDESPQYDMFWAWNSLNEVIAKLRDAFSNASQAVVDVKTEILLPDK